MPFEPLPPDFETPTAAINTVFSVDVNENKNPGATQTQIATPYAFSPRPSLVSNSSGLSQTLLVTYLSRTAPGSLTNVTLTAPDNSDSMTKVTSGDAKLTSSIKRSKALPLAVMKFLPSSTQKTAKLPKEKNSFAKLFPLRSSSKKAAPQLPPMSIPRRPVPIAKTVPPPPAKSSTDVVDIKPTADTVQDASSSSSSPLDSAQQAALSVVPSSTKTNTSSTLESGSTKIDTGLLSIRFLSQEAQVISTLPSNPAVPIVSNNHLQVPRKTSEIKAQRHSEASRLSTILNAYSQSFDQSSEMGFLDVLTSAVTGNKNNTITVKPKPVASAPKPTPELKESITKSSSISGAESSPKVTDNGDYDYSVYTQYSGDDQKTSKQTFSSTNSLQVPGVKLCGAGMYLNVSATESSASNFASDRPVSLMSDILSSYSSQPSTPVSADSGSALNAVSSSSPDPINTNNFFTNKDKNTASHVSSANSGAVETPSSRLPSTENTESQLWRRRSIKNDMPAQVINLALFSASNPVSASASTTVTVDSSNAPQPSEVQTTLTSSSVIGFTETIIPDSKQLPHLPLNKSSDIVSPSDSVYSQDSSMGQAGSKLRTKAQNTTGSSRNDVPIRRLPTPDYERENVKTSIVEEVMSPMPLSPASSPKENKMITETTSTNAVLAKQMASSSVVAASTPTSGKKPIMRKAVGSEPTPTAVNIVSVPVVTPPESSVQGTAYYQQQVSLMQSTAVTFNSQQMPGTAHNTTIGHRRPSQARSTQGGQSMGGSRPSSTVYKDVNYEALPSPSAQALYFPKQGTTLLPTGVPIFAPKLSSSHFNCFHQHQRMIRVSNRSHPLTCQICEKAETEEFQRCHWCALRICAPCANVLRLNRGNLIVTLERIKTPGLY